MKIPKRYAQELLNIHTNKISANNTLTNAIIDHSPPNISYVNIKHRLFHIANNLKHIPICSAPHCNNPVKWDARNQKYTNTCGYACSNKIIAQSTIEKRKRTNNKKYGGNAPACSPTVIEKMQKTAKNKFGDDYTHEINKLSKQAILKKYGVTNRSQVHISDKSRTLLESKQYLYNEHITKKQALHVIASNLGVSDTTINRYLNQHNITPKRFYKSSGEIEITNFLKSLNINFITNTKKLIHPLELDIFIPDYNIAIEYNGVFWHSEKNGTHKNAHLLKTELCEKKGIRLIHIFEDEWRDQQDKCKDTLKHLLGKSEKGVYARNCNIKEITWKEAKPFLNKYHLLNAGTAGNYNIGAFDKDNNLIGVMVFGIPNNENSNTHNVELKRFVTNKKNNPGLGSKMFKFAIREKEYKEVFAFVDRRWFTGLVKDHIGFKLIHITPPALWWTDGKYRYHRRFITKKQLNNNISSKRKILNNMGYYRIWDCGKLKLKWSYTP